MRIHEDEVGLNEKPEDTRCIEIRPEASGVRAKDSIPNIAIIRNCGLWKVQGTATGSQLSFVPHVSPPREAIYTSRNMINAVILNFL